MSNHSADEPTAVPRVTIGLPVYNGENYLAEAIDSILGQTFTDFELIISDNASTDRTEEICRRYAAEDDRIRYFRHDRNRGASPNYNFTVEKARGEYFKWAAHDDVLHATVSRGGRRSTRCRSGRVAGVLQDANDQSNMGRLSVPTTNLRTRLRIDAPRTLIPGSAI